MLCWNDRVRQFAHKSCTATCSLLLLAGGLIATSNIAAGQDPMPVGSIAFYESSACPSGWVPYTPARGRAILPAGPDYAIGGTVGAPLAGGAGPLHNHAFEVTVRVNSHDYEAHAPLGLFLVGGNIRLTGVTSVDGASIPVVKRILCQKTSPASEGAVPVGLTAFFDQPSCPPGWAQSARTTGRFLVGLPVGAEPAGFGSTHPIANLEDRTHQHRISGTLNFRARNITWRCEYCSPQDVLNIADSGSAPFKGDAFPASSGLPYIQLLHCEKAAPEAPQINSIVHAASFAARPAAPGQLVTLYGAAMSDDASHFAQIDPPGYLARQLAGVSVMFDEFPAALFFVRKDQINAQVPYGIAGREKVTVRVIRDGTTSEGIELAITDAAPELFVHQDDLARAIAIHSDGSLNAGDNPAREGDIVVMYATGEGQTIPLGETGKLATAPFPTPLQDLAVSIGGVAAETVYAGAAPGFSALLQLNVRVPRVSGRVPIQLGVGANGSRSGVDLFVE